MTIPTRQSFKTNTLTKVRKIAWVGMAICSVIIVGIAIYSILAPQPVPSAAVVSTDISLSAMITVSAEIPQIPEKIPLLQASVGTSTIQSIFQKFSQTHNLTNQSADGNMLSSEDGMVIVQYAEDDQRVQLLNQHNLPIYSPVASPLTSQELDLRVQEFVGELEIFSSFTFSSPEPILFSVYNTVPTSPNEANGYIYKAFPTHAAIPIVFDDQTLSPIEIFIRTDGKIVKAEFPSVIYDFSMEAESQTLSADEISNNIANGQVTYLRADNTDITEAAPTSLENVTLIPERIEYRMNKNNGAVIPYLKLTGLGRGGETLVDVTAIAPIVPTE